jgi:hypothetical protein
LFEGDDLGVVAVVVEVGAFADDFAIADKNATDLWIGRGEACGVCGEFEGLPHEGFVVNV